MSTITEVEQKKIADFLADHELPVGLGTAEKACSIASINLTLSGRLTDQIPDCMSYVIGRWIIRVQDAMPSEIRNSVKWKSLLPFAAGTGRNADAEKRRMNIILSWMWDTVLPHIQPIADARGFGVGWKAMTDHKDREHALAAKKAATDAAATATAAAATASYATASYAAAYASYAAAATASYAAAYASYAATAYDAAATAYDAAAYASYAATAAAYAATRKAAWDHFDPCTLLEKLIET